LLGLVMRYLLESYFRMQLVDLALVLLMRRLLESCFQTQLVQSYFRTQLVDLVSEDLVLVGLVWAGLVLVLLGNSN
jgi:hypothetical protein